MKEDVAGLVRIGPDSQGQGPGRDEPNRINETRASGVLTTLKTASIL